MKATNTYLVFDGNCAAAMNYYAECLGTEVQIVRFADAPVPCGPDANDRVMHAFLSKGPVVLMASDTMPGMPFHHGDNFAINLACDDAAEAQTLFDAFGKGGKVTMPLQETFWAAQFGMLTDQFGINWMFNVEKPHGQQKG